MNNKLKKNNKKIATSLYLISLFFNIFAIINSLILNNNSKTNMFMYLGTAFLCLGTIYLNKDKKNDNNGEN